MIDDVTRDKTSLITIDHGRTDSTDGRFFPYVFPLLLNPYSETSGIIKFIGSRVGGLEKLQGKKIIVLYHGSPYGKETIPIFELLAKSTALTYNRLKCRPRVLSNNSRGWPSAGPSRILWCCVPLV
ncbi:TPA: hypothetical protein R1R14_004215 [Enterobacter hormaechei]|uniref:hypothetical protein n=1 Tax=Enterobacteriaceae TaxID=543 RepID=UPI000ACE7B68|nr:MULTISPECIES: hypothetical protein [Enterobacteriaceae]HBM7601060.1 hypothetical protein [Enterobacter asburiae]HBR1984258.1 hypothetical protein [Klebsiella quasipneumoniae subsp. quasipneumoniae]HCI6708497.1 hypothetical protein [Klebsiella quasipneumoniae subsp. similipneumoniae]ELS4527941.1 hypothetical protein [Enterobacter hormaechei]MBJ6502820.1 hypothetical protein [Enterobacter hormaechei]